MTIGPGVDAIGWSDDDMREIGCGTPLKSCLSEVREPRFEDMEPGHKFPHDPVAQK
jgi:inosose dehydratase